MGLTAKQSLLLLSEIFGRIKISYTNIWTKSGLILTTTNFLGVGKHVRLLMQSCRFFSSDFS